MVGRARQTAHKFSSVFCFEVRTMDTRIAAKDFAAHLISKIDVLDNSLRRIPRSEYRSFLFLPITRLIPPDVSGAGPIAVEPQVFDLLVDLMHNRPEVVRWANSCVGLWRPGRCGSAPRQPGRLRQRPDPPPGMTGTRSPDAPAPPPLTVALTKLV